MRKVLCGTSYANGLTVHCTLYAVHYSDGGHWHGTCYRGEYVCTLLRHVQYGAYGIGGAQTEAASYGGVKWEIYFILFIFP